MLFEHGGDLVRDLVPVEPPEAGVALAAEIAEVELVQDDGLHGAVLLALERAQPVRHRTGVELGQLTPHGVQRAHGRTVVVLVVAYDHPLRDAVERPRPHRNRADLSQHGGCPFLPVGVSCGFVFEACQRRVRAQFASRFPVHGATG